MVLIAYDDVDHVEAALSSALSQTFGDIEVVAVDDASSDGTGELLDHLARRDGRVRVVHLAENSGGCSVPRNTGIGAARGEWLMFLDSDDCFEPTACARLLEAANRHDADVACAAMLRVDAGRGRSRVRFGWLYEQERAVAGLRACPDLLTDVMVQNKIFRRSLIEQHRIRFPVGVHYEDMDFTARALAYANRIAVVPDVVYRYVQHDRADRPSISHRVDVDGFADRIAVHRMMDEFLKEQRLPDAKLAKDVKFLQHDLRMHLQDLDRAAPDVRATLVGMAQQYVAETDPRAVRRLRPAQRLLVALVRRGDPAWVARAVRLRRIGGTATRRAVDTLPSGVLRRLERPASKA